MSQTSNYVVWYHTMTDGIAKLDEIDNVDGLSDLTFARSRAKGWPANVTVAMSRNSKKDLGLADAMSGEFLFVSTRLKSAVEAARAGNIEFLPVSILNHKGRVAAADYFIMNPLDIVDCFDAKASGAKLNPINPTRYLPPRGLVLKEDQIPPHNKIFALKGLTTVVIVRRELADDLMTQGMTGFYFMELEEFS